MREHIGKGAGGKMGWYLVPDGVAWDERKSFYAKFLDGGETYAWRKQQLVDLFTQLTAEKTLPLVSAGGRVRGRACGAKQWVCGWAI